MTATRSWRRRSAAALTGGALVLVATGCAGDARIQADDDAAAAAAGITRYLQSEVVVPGAPAADQPAEVRRWLAAPSADYVASSGEPELRVLADAGRRIDVVVHHFGRRPPVGNEEPTWGYACVRYTVDRAARLQATSIDCPKGLSRDPDG